MIYRTYGKTGVSLSAIGFGGMRFNEKEPVETNAALMKACYDAGINYFDTAPLYGKSEDFFGVALQEMKKTRNERPFYVSTKTFKTTPSEVRQDLETSLKRMGLEHIDFYHFWCILSLDEYRDRKKKGVLKEFERLKDEGLIGHICVSSHMNGSDTAEMLKDYPFEGVLLGYSAMNFAYREAGVDAAARLNRGVVVMNPLGGGLIPQNPDRFAFVKTRADETVVEGALRFLIDDPRISVSLVGMSYRDHLTQALNAINGYQPLTAESRQKIRDSLKDAFNELCTACQYCDECPIDIPIPKMMDAYNQYLFSGKPGDMTVRLPFNWGISLEETYAKKCTECGICENLCTQKLPIRERLKFIRQEVEKQLAQKKT